mgnify:CR=1 FL=1
MKTMIFSYAGPISGLQKALDEHIEQSDKDDLQDMGDCDILGYCTSQCRYYGSGCEMF